ncbi:MAG: acyl-protein synthetase [Oscillospiraceae bacterium]|nr:acyl-protein synthetase [Oscillospiraceae bacterium]
MDARNQLFAYKRPYDLDHTADLFVSAMKQNINLHRAKCPDYDKILAERGYQTDCLKTEQDLKFIPPIPTMFYKAHTLSSVPDQKMVIKSTTSGTKGTPTKVGLDLPTCYYGALMLLRILSYYKLFSVVPTNYIILGYQPSKHNKMGAVKTAYGATFLAPALHREYALKDTGSSYRLNIEGIKAQLLRYQRLKLPVRFIGFPAYLSFLIQTLRENNIKLKLNPHSKILLGGGWKQFLSEEVDKEALYQMVEETLGIEARNVKEFFAVVESNVLFCDCKHHHFHVPIYARVIIRDPRTMEPVPNGTPGLLNLISPLVSSMPLGSIITDDIAVLYDGKQCGCGMEAPYFEILGRVGMKEIKTCAAGAGEVLQGERR